MTDELARMLASTRRYLFTTVLAPASPLRIAAALQTPPSLAALARAETLAETGDTIATNHACNVWVRAVQAALVPPCPPVWVTDGTGTYCLRCEERQDEADGGPETRGAGPTRRDPARKG